MEQRLSLITLGVTDVPRLRTFYESLGWSGQEVDGTVFFQAGGVALILWAREKLADDAGVADDGATFAGLALAQNVRTRKEVDDAPTSPRSRSWRTARSSFQTSGSHDLRERICSAGRVANSRT